MRPQLPDLDAAETVFARRSDKEEFMAIMDPLAPEHNIAKSMHRVMEFQDLMKAASNAALTDCTCARHKVDECLLYPYRRKLLRFTDQNHSLLAKVFAAAISHNQCHSA